jgi:stage II sporulation protein D
MRHAARALLLSALLVQSWTAIVSAHARTVPPGRGAMLVIKGAGDGHGVGMSQQGALGYAQHGFSYAAILAHYYTGTSLGRAPRGRKVRVLIGGTVRRVPLERYVRGVIANEVSPSWPMAALEAQAVASRTYALTAHAGGARFDVYADSRSQVYGGRAAETPRTNAAVKATEGQIVTYAGRPAITYFFASSGGLTEDIQNAFPGSEPEPWLRGVDDPYERGDLHRWTVRMSLAQAGTDLAGLVRGSLRAIVVLERGYSPRIVRAQLVGSGGRTTVSGPELAARLHLYSTWAYFYLQRSHRMRREPDRSHYRHPPPEAPGAPSPTGPPIGGGTPGGGAPPGGGTGSGEGATAALAGGSPAAAVSARSAP